MGFRGGPNGERRQRSVVYSPPPAPNPLRTARRTGAVPCALRGPRRLAAYYEGLDLLEPGIVSCPLWRPEPGTSPEPTDVYGGVAYTV